MPLDAAQSSTDLASERHDKTEEKLLLVRAREGVFRASLKPCSIAPISLLSGTPKARTVIERSMKSKYLSAVLFSRVNGASNWPTCKMARFLHGASATKSSVVLRLAGATGAAPAGGARAKSPAIQNVDEAADPAARLEARTLEQERLIRSLVGAVEEIAVNLQAAAREQDEVVVGRAQGIATGRTWRSRNADRKTRPSSPVSRPRQTRVAGVSSRRRSESAGEETGPPRPSLGPDGRDDEARLSGRPATAPDLPALLPKPRQPTWEEIPVSASAERLLCRRTRTRPSRA
jgi:hypothetical protein